MKLPFFTCMAIELLHTFALIHDDIIDQSVSRRGLTTPHIFFEQMHRNEKWDGKSEHFGVSAAILTGDLAHIYADEVFTTSPFPMEALKRAYPYYDILRVEVIFGEHLDVLGGVKQHFDEQGILQMLKYKSGKYTIERPLHLGLALANAPENMFTMYSGYGIPLGQAFQIQDDILGLFGDEEKTGKPTDSDIKEGKRTLLVIKAYEKANKTQKNLLDRTLGNPRIKESDVERVRDVVRQTGSYQYSKDLAMKLIYQAKKALSSSFMTEDAYSYLTGIADYMLERDY